MVAAEAAAAEAVAEVSAEAAHPEDGKTHQDASAGVLPRDRRKQPKTC